LIVFLNSSKSSKNLHCKLSLEHHHNLNLSIFIFWILKDFFYCYNLSSFFYFGFINFSKSPLPNKLKMFKIIFNNNLWSCIKSTMILHFFAHFINTFAFLNFFVTTFLYFFYFIFFFLLKFAYHLQTFFLNFVFIHFFLLHLCIYTFLINGPVSVLLLRKGVINFVCATIFFLVLLAADALSFPCIVAYYPYIFFFILGLVLLNGALKFLFCFLTSLSILWHFSLVYVNTLWVFFSFFFYLKSCFWS